jgi:hypothetical protein
VLISSPLAEKLSLDLLNRYNKRRNKDLITLLLYINTEAIPKTEKGFEYSTKSAAKELALSQYSRLFPEKASEVLSSPTDHDGTIQHEIAQLLKPAKKLHVNNLETDLKLLEATGTKSPRIEKLNRALLTVQPTSIEKPHEPGQFKSTFMA